MRFPPPSDLLRDTTNSSPPLLGAARLQKDKRDPDPTEYCFLQIELASQSLKISASQKCVDYCTHTHNFSTYWRRFVLLNI